jgi:hypothetical protein
VSNRRIVLPGVILGVLLLALAAVFAVGLPKLHDEGDIALPDTLPGGYTATDLDKAYRGAPGATAEKISQASASERSARSYGDKAMAAAGITGVTRTYVDKSLSSPVIVQVFRAAGGAFAPFEFSDPKSAQAGQDVKRLVRKGDVVCIENGTADGNGGLQPAYVQCQESQGGLTVQVTTPLAVAKAVKVVGTVLDEVA